MSEEAAPAPEAVEPAPEAAEPASAEPAPAVEQLPDANEGGGEESFMSALDTAFEALDVSAKPAAEEAEQPTDPAEQPAADEAEKSFDPTDDLSDSLEDGWTPKAANRFKQLKSELKQNTTELDRYRQLYEENEQKIKELAGMTESKDVPRKNPAIREGPDRQ